MYMRKKLLICTAACMLTAGTVAAQENNAGTIRTDPSTSMSQGQQYDHVAANTGVREGRFGRFTHRMFPQDDPFVSEKFTTQATDVVERPSAAPTTEELIRRPSLD
jgi:hypothetical protein